tara:strand:+ start:2599 stop:2910 length:312 start_codon:yes stop_codon:yes gene_type:complete
MENKLDMLVEEIELLSNVITKLNFDMEGLKEDNDKLVEDRPFMVRQIQANEKKLFKFMKQIGEKMEVKHELDAKLNVARMEEEAKKPKEKTKKDKNLKQTKTK